MNAESIKRPYRRWRGKLRKAWRRMQGDMEALFACRDPDRARIKALREIHAGRVGFLIGNGPSVRTDDLDRLKGEITFGCNRLYLAYGKTMLRPSYLCSADPHMIRDFGAEMIARAETKMVFMSVLKPHLPGDYLWAEIDSEGPFSFTRNALKPMNPGGGTLIAALQLGYWMGIRQFVLYGVDHSFPKEKQTVVGSDGRSQFVTGEGNHFISGYRSGKAWVAPWTTTIEDAFRICDAVLRQEGGWLINATRQTQLPDIERVGFEEALVRAGRVSP